MSQKHFLALMELQFDLWYIYLRICIFFSISKNS